MRRTASPPSNERLGACSPPNIDSEVLSNVFDDGTVMRIVLLCTLTSAMNATGLTAAAGPVRPGNCGGAAGAPLSPAHAAAPTLAVAAARVRANRRSER